MLFKPLLIIVFFAACFVVLVLAKRCLCGGEHNVSSSNLISAKPETGKRVGELVEKGS